MAEDFSVGIGVELDGDVDIQKKLNELSKNKNFHIDVKTLRLSDNAEKTLVENIKGIRGLGVQIDEVQISKTAISKLQNELAKNKIPLMIDMPSVDGKLHKELDKIKQSGNQVANSMSGAKKSTEGLTASLKDVVYHAGVLSKLNKAETNGRFYGSHRGTGYYGTGHYFVDKAHKHEITQGHYKDLPMSSVDISKYTNLFKANTDEIANNLHNFLYNLTRYTQNAYTENLDVLFKEYENVFGKDTLPKNDFKSKLNELKAYMKSSSLSDRNDSVSTQFMKSLGYQGVDTRGTHFADVRYGTVIYDLKEESVLQANITNELQKQSDMLEKIHYGKGQVFDKSEDERLNSIIEQQKHATEIESEYRKIFDDTSLRKYIGEVEVLENKLKDIEQIIEKCQYEIDNPDKVYSSMKKTFSMLDMPIDEDLLKEQAKESLLSYKNRINEVTEEKTAILGQIDSLKEKIKVEKEYASIARENAKRNIENRKQTIVGANNVTKVDSNTLGTVSEAFKKSINDITGGIGKDVTPVVSKATQEAEAQINKFVRDIESKAGKVSKIDVTSRTRTIPGDEEAGILPSAVLEADRVVVKYTTDLGESKTATFGWRKAVSETGEEVENVWGQLGEHVSKNLDAVEKATEKAIKTQTKFQEKANETAAKAEREAKSLYSKATDTSESKPIIAGADEVAEQVKKVNIAAEELRNSTQENYSDLKIQLDNEIQSLKDTIARLRDAENAASTLRAKSTDTVRQETLEKALRLEQDVKAADLPLKNLPRSLSEIIKELNNPSLSAGRLKQVSDELDVASSKFKTAQNAAKNFTGSTFNTSELDAQGKMYIQKVSANVTAIREKLITTLTSPRGKYAGLGITDVGEVQAIQDAKGKVESFTVTVKNLRGEVQKLEFARAKIQGSGKAQGGFIQTNTFKTQVKDGKSLAKVISTLESEIAKSEESWRNSGILAGQFAEKLEAVKSSLGSVTSFEGLKKVEADFRELATEGTKASKEVESGIRKINTATSGDSSSDLETKISKIRESYRKITDVPISSGNFSVEQSQLDSLAEKYNRITELKTRFEQSGNDAERVSNYRALVDVLNQVENELKQVKTAQDNVQKNEKMELLRKKYISDINAYISSNTRMTKEMRDDFLSLSREIENASVVTTDFGKEISLLKNKVKAAGLEGRSFFDEMGNSARKVANWLGATTIVMTTIHKVREAIDEIRELDNILTEISKTSDLTNHQLEQLGKNAYGAASQFGKKASDYLVGVQEMYRAGYQNAEDMAKLSVLAQAAGDMSTDVANDYLIATDAAYHYKGNVEQLTAALDGMNYITNHNALSMNDLASAMKIAASQSANVGVGVDEAAAAMGTMIATTRQSGDAVARAWRGILANLQGIKVEFEDGEVIDEEQLSKYEKAAKALGVSLKEVKNGVLSVRDPIQVIKELSEAYNALDEKDVRRTNLINAVGGKYRGNALSSLLTHPELFDKMLKEYSEGSGSAMEEAEKSANNLE